MALPTFANYPNVSSGHQRVILFCSNKASKDHLAYPLAIGWGYAMWGENLCCSCSEDEDYRLTMNWNTL